MRTRRISGGFAVRFIRWFCERRVGRRGRIMSENRIQCPLCRTGTYPHFGYTGSGVCDHCGAEWTYDETDTLTDSAMRALWEKIPRWIPVTERLPEIGVSVLCSSNDPPGEDLVWIGQREQYDWYFPGANEMGAPTHWMPLPAPPTDGK